MTYPSNYNTQGHYQTLRSFCILNPQVLKNSPASIQSVVTNDALYYMLDTTEIYAHFKSEMQLALNEDQIKAIFQECLVCVDPTLGEYAKKLSTIPDYRRLRIPTPSPLEVARQKEVVLEAAFRFYVKVKEEGLLIPINGVLQFPFLVQYLTVSAAVLQVDQYELGLYLDEQVRLFANVNVTAN